VRLIFVGPPGAGKGTQAAKVVERHGIPHISTGDMFRAEIEEGTPLGKLAGKLIARGSLVPDDVTVSMVVSRIERPDCCQGFLLDGFPRTLPQAEALEEALAAHNKRLDAVILLEVPDELIVERISGRRVDPLTGEIYHIKYNPPPPEIAGRVIQRPDDTEATCRRRLEKYHSETEAILPFYEARGLLVRVDGTTDTEEVAANVADALAALA
jgi:adenylate kinase